jgi:hypothetical protein
MWGKTLYSAAKMNCKFITKLKLRLFSAIAVAFLMCSCTTTSLKRTWKSPDPIGEPPNKIAVVVVDQRPLVSNIIEGQMVSHLEAEGQAAARVRNFLSLPEIIKDKQRAAAELRRQGADAVLIIRLVDKSLLSRPQQPTKSSGGSYFISSSGTSGWFEYYSVAMTGMNSVSPSLDQDFYIESSLYDLASEKRLWYCVTKSKLKENADWLDLVPPFATTVVTAMAKDGVIH